MFTDVSLKRGYDREMSGGNASASRKHRESALLFNMDNDTLCTAKFKFGHFDKNGFIITDTSLDTSKVDSAFHRLFQARQQPRQVIVLLFVIIRNADNSSKLIFDNVAPFIKRKS